jgi:hypothetical protein
MEKPLRVAGIIVCGLMLGVPALVCFREGVSAHSMGILHTINALFPVTFWALSRFFIDEGRARERADREQTNQEQQH